jgi:DNA-binding ferritin-like protein
MMLHRRVMSRWLRMAASRNLQVFDFDDTLVSSQGSVSIKKSNGENLNLDSATFAHYKPSDGDELDFGAFNDVINPRIIKKNFDHLKASLAQPDTKVVILTARSKGAETSVTKFLESLGVKGVQVVGLQSSDPEDKANWIDQAIEAEHAEQMDFFDDSSANAAAVAAHENRHKTVKFKSHNTPHPHEADYDGPAIKTHFKSTNPQVAKVKYKTPTQTEKPESGHKPSGSDWWHEQTDTFKQKYCGDHPASGHCASVKVASNAALVKKIRDRAKKSGNKKVIEYMGTFAEKMDQAGNHAGAWFESLEKSFDGFRRKPEGLFKGWTSADFDDLYDALFGPQVRKDKAMKNASVAKVANTFILGSLLACLRAAHQAHWTAHWTAEGANFYSDHQLFDRLYSGITGEIDGLAEKIVALYGSAGVALPEQMIEMAQYIVKWTSTHPTNLVRRSQTIEADIQMAIDTTRKALEAEGNMSLGMDNFLQGLADAHETPQYLLGQRLKDKRASQADRAQIYSVARRFRLDQFVYDQSTTKEGYLDSLKEFLQVMSWAASEFDKYGPDGPSGKEIAQKLQGNQAAKMIAQRNRIPLTDMWEVMMDDMNPDTMLFGLNVILQNLGKFRPSELTARFMPKR